jgi:heme exporter protein C
MPQRSIFLRILEVVSAVLFIIFVWMVFFYAPLEASMGAVQRVFYFHVATAWVGMLGFIASGVAGIVYLSTHDLKWDIVEVAAVEISLVFFLITIILGSIWAYPAWNTWWTWEPRLTTAAVLELIYMAYLLLRQGIEETEKRARFGAVYAIVAGLSVPLTFMSIRLFRTIHPVVVGSVNAAAKGGFDMTPHMLQTLLFSVLVFSFLFVVLFWHRIRLGQLAQKVEQLKLNYND